MTQIGILNMKQKTIPISNLIHQKTMNNSRLPNGELSFDNLPLVLRVEDLMPLLSIGRNTAYELVRSGQIRNFRIGRCYRIPKDSVAEYLEKVRKNT